MGIIFWILWNPNTYLIFISLILQIRKLSLGERDEMVSPWSPFEPPPCTLAAQSLVWSGCWVSSSLLPGSSRQALEGLPPGSQAVCWSPVGTPAPAVPVCRAAWSSGRGPCEHLPSVLSTHPGAPPCRWEDRVPLRPTVLTG